MTLGLKTATDPFAHRPELHGSASAARSRSRTICSASTCLTAHDRAASRPAPTAIVLTVTPRLKQMRRWFYINMRRALDPSEPRESAILAVPENRRIKSDYDRKIDIDLSTLCSNTNTSCSNWIGSCDLDDIDDGLLVPQTHAATGNRAFQWRTSTKRSCTLQDLPDPPSYALNDPDASVETVYLVFEKVTPESSACTHSTRHRDV